MTLIWWHMDLSPLSPHRHRKRNKMNIRRAEEKDIPRIHELLLQVDMVHQKGRPDLFKIGRKYSDEELIGILHNDTRPIFVACDEGDLVLGYAFCVLKQAINNSILTDIKTLYIDDLCVDETMRGCHVGKALYVYTKEYAKEIGCYNVTLNVWSCNPSAIAFYESCGLVPQKIGMEEIL